MSSDQTMLPCKCGYEGALLGTHSGAFYSLQCPECSNFVEAFTIRGLGEAWNEAQQGKEQGAGE